MDNLKYLTVSNFLKQNASKDVDDEEMEEFYKKKNDITKKSEEFIQNLALKGYIAPKENNWLSFILNSLYYIVLVLIVGIIGGNLNILSEGMHKTKNGNSGLENKLREIFPHTQFAMDKLRIDQSVDPYPQKVGTKKYPYDKWCSICDLTVQLRLLFILWPLKIFDNSNYMMFTMVSSFIKNYIKTTGVLRNFLIPILLGLLIYLQLPVMISLIVALFSSTLHPHFLQYWAGIIVSWKFIKKYVKSFLKIITGLKNLSTVEYQFLDARDRRARRARNASVNVDDDYTKIKIRDYFELLSDEDKREVFSDVNNETWTESWWYYSPSWNENTGVVTDLAKYLAKREKQNTRPLSDNLNKIIFQSIKKNFGGKIARKSGLIINDIKTNMKSDIQDLKNKNNFDIKNLKFMVELYVFNEFVKGGGKIGSHRRGKLLEVVGTPDPVPGGVNQNDKIESMVIMLKKIVMYLEDKDILFSDVLNKKSKIKDGMWTRKEWEDRTGKNDDQDYENYKIAYKIKKKKTIRKLKKMRKKNQKNYDYAAWTLLITCVILQTLKYIVDYSEYSDINSDDRNINSEHSRNGKLEKRGGAGEVGGVIQNEILNKPKNFDTSNSKDKGKDITAILATKVKPNMLFFAMATSIKFLFDGIKLIGKKVAGVAALLPAATTVSMLKFILLYFMFGWWVTPTYGIGICIAYSLATQFKMISLLLFTSLNKKYINATIDYLRNNRYGLTIMGLLMLSYSAITYLRPNVAAGALISLLVCSIIIICCI